MPAPLLENTHSPISSNETIKSFFSLLIFEANFLLLSGYFPTFNTVPFFSVDLFNFFEM